jgi:hypothetical protein
MATVVSTILIFTLCLAAAVPELLCYGGRTVAISSAARNMNLEAETPPKVVSLARARPDRGFRDLPCREPGDGGARRITRFCRVRRCLHGTRHGLCNTARPAE